MNTVSPVDKSLEVPRKPRCLTFSPDGQVIVISGNIIIALKPRNRDGPSVSFWCLTDSLIVTVEVESPIAMSKFVQLSEQAKPILVLLTYSTEPLLLFVPCSFRYMPETLDDIQTFEAHHSAVVTSSPVLCMTTHPHQALLATSVESELRVWNVHEDDALELQLLHSSTLSEKDFISHLHFMTGSGLLLVTYCFSHEVRLVDPRNMQTISSNRSSSNIYTASVSPCEKLILVHDSSSAVELYNINGWAKLGRYTLAPPMKWQWKRHPVVFGLSAVYAAGKEGQITEIPIEGPFATQIPIVDCTRVFALAATTADRPLLAIAHRESDNPTTFRVEIWPEYHD